MKIITVCGNGIGSSLMLAMKIQELCDAEGITADVESCDANSAPGKTCDLYVTVKELAPNLDQSKTLIVRSYTNKKKIKEDVLELLKSKSLELNNN
ncbi:PTS sugar transporter subunit IIB [Romboutsia sp. CE17]|uniref:PTS sugar transporter subunit IIB n=1 Tax=Romboutsia sp. CE17 TaxID=2724150 RepID=UPI001442D46E|nr:PTS sugar transporter subunit IIB [Romboutsia sp. CE17]QJA07481.1 PTS sugar transporter subunit IIB [Romboutsia sp. CE17]